MLGSSDQWTYALSKLQMDWNQSCEGKNIRLNSYNSRGYRIGEVGVIPEDYDPEYDGSAAVK